MRIFVTFENYYLVASRCFKRRVTPFFRSSNPPAGTNAQKLCEKALFRGEIRRCAFVFFSSREQQPLFEKKRREATGSSRKHGGVQVNFLVILEDHRLTHTYAKREGSAYPAYSPDFCKSQGTVERKKNRRRSHSP